MTVLTFLRAYPFSPQELVPTMMSRKRKRDAESSSGNNSASEESSGDPEVLAEPAAVPQPEQPQPAELVSPCAECGSPSQWGCKGCIVTTYCSPECQNAH